MKDYPRHKRVGEEVRRQLSVLIREHLDDPKVQWVSISNVEMTRDLSYAKVFVTHLQDDDLQSSIDTLNKASGFLRARIGEQLRLRVLPELKFLEDLALREGQRVSELIDTVISASNTDGATSSDKGQSDNG